MSDPRAAILALADVVEREPLDGMPGAYVHRLSVADMDQVLAATEHRAAVLFVLAVRDEDGKPLFQTADIPALLKLPVRRFRRMVGQVDAFNSLTEEDAEKN